MSFNPNSRLQWRSALLALALAPVSFSVARAQMPALPPAPVAASLPQGDAATQAAYLVSEAFTIAQRTPAARPIAVKTAAALLPRLPVAAGARGRDALTKRWLDLAQSGSVSRAQSADAFSAFFDVAARTDADYALKWAGGVSNHAERAGAYLDVSRAVEKASWTRADQLAAFGARAARRETDPLRRARALVFVADRMTEFSPARAQDAIAEASTNIGRLKNVSARDNLYAELIPAAARYDVNMAREMSGRIRDTDLKNLAGARINIAEASLSSVTTRTKDRVQLLATAAAPYDRRALPFLVKLPPEPSVLKAISETLPPVYPSAHPAIEVSQLESLWNYGLKAPEGVYRDQLQSRLARLMVTQDLWRGRDWGKQLAWKGGRVQVGAFLKDVLAYRSSQLRVGALQDVAQKDVPTALAQTRALNPVARTEALLLLAGQILSGGDLIG